MIKIFKKIVKFVISRCVNLIYYAHEISIVARSPVFNIEDLMSKKAEKSKPSDKLTYYTSERQQSYLSIAPNSHWCLSLSHSWCCRDRQNTGTTRVHTPPNSQIVLSLSVATIMWFGRTERKKGFLVRNARRNSVFYGDWRSS